MARETNDGNGQQVAQDLNRRGNAAPAAVVPLPPTAPMADANNDAFNGGGGVGIDILRKGNGNIADMSVHLAPPGFTVCESFFDSGNFTCFSSVVVCGKQVVNVPGTTAFTMGNEVWCNVFITHDNGTTQIEAHLDRAQDLAASYTVHIADIAPDGVKQYHVGAIIIPKDGASSEDVDTDDCSIEYTEPAETSKKLQIKGWESTQPTLEYTLAQILQQNTAVSAPPVAILVKTADGCVGYLPIGDIPIDGDNCKCVIGIDYLGEDDVPEHPYAIRIRYGSLQYKNNFIGIFEDQDAVEYIDTTPLTKAMIDALDDSGSSSGA